MDSCGYVWGLIGRVPLVLKFNVNLDFTSGDYNIVSIERFRVSVQVDGVIGLERTLHHIYLL